MAADWATSHFALVRAFGLKHAHVAGTREAGALFHWAVICVSSLHYLTDLDDAVYANPLDGHNLDTVDVAHARWATSTAMTALDVCAAGLGRAYCGVTGGYELSLTNFDLAFNKPQRDRHRGAIPATALSWLDALVTDARYREIRSARHALIHSRVPRHFTAPRQRLRLTVNGQQVGVRQIIEDANSLATGAVEDLLTLLPTL